MIATLATRNGITLDQYISRRRPKIAAKHGEANAAEWERCTRSRTSLPWHEESGPADVMGLASPVSTSRFIPGGLTQIDVFPPPRWPIELRNTRQVHGLLSAAVGQHTAPVPSFSLIAAPSTSFGWAAYWHTTAVALALADKRHRGQLYSRPCEVHFGPCRQFAWPEPLAPGSYRRHIQTITPVVVRSSHRDGTKRVHRTADESSISHALTQNLPVRLGLTGDTASQLHRQAGVKLLAGNTVPREIPVGGKWGDEKSGVIVGWEGWALLELNAVAAWLLECAGLIGMGGRTGIGFGRVEVSRAG